LHAEREAETPDFYGDPRKPAPEKRVCSREFAERINGHQKIPMME
jgi:hypothetical protein